MNNLLAAVAVSSLALTVGCNGPGGGTKVCPSQAKTLLDEGVARVTSAYSNAGGAAACNTEVAEGGNVYTIASAQYTQDESPFHTIEESVIAYHFVDQRRYSVGWTSADEDIPTGLEYDDLVVDGSSYSPDAAQACIDYLDAKLAWTTIPCDL